MRVGSLPHSLRIRLALVICLLLTSVVAVFLWVAFREVHSALIDAGKGRALIGANQIANTFERSARQTVRTWRRGAADDAVRRCLTTASGGDCAAARPRLAALATAGPRRIVLWDLSGHALVDIEVPGNSPDVRAPSRATFVAQRVAGVTPFRAEGATAVFDVVTDVKSESGRPLGRIVVHAPLVLTPGLLKTFAGADADAAIGNATGGVWTDGASITPPPPPGLLQKQSAEFRSAAGAPRVGAVAAIGGTPWAVWVHSARAAVVAPARRFLQDMSLIAVVGILIGGLIAALIGMTITRPIAELSRAAGAIAAGDYSRRVAINAGDEVGRLGEAFNAMIDHVNDTLLALSRKEAQNRAIIEVAFDCMISMDARGLITEFNPAAERTFGFHREDVIGKALAELIIPPELRAAHRAGLARYLATGEGRMIGQLVEVPGLHADGSRIPIELALSAFEADGSIIFTAVLRNIAERKRGEEARQRAAIAEEQHRRAVEANRLKSEFLASMSHELRTPLNAIIGFTEFMHEGKAGPLAPQQREYLGDVLTSSRHLLQLINDVLDLAKVEAGKMEFSPEPVDLRDVVSEVADVLRGLAVAKALTLSIDVAPTATAAVTDPARIRQILYNYLSNAIKFTREGGRVELRILPDGPSDFRIEVRDTGIGIDPADVPRLFTEFLQLDTGSRRQGTGLGLALTRRIVEALGGRVGVESVLGTGSTFWAVLPRDAHTTSSHAA